MNKEQVLKTIKESIDQNIVSKDEVIAVATGHTLATTGTADTSDKSSIVPKVLYTIGGVIAVIGVIVLLSNNWNAIGFAGRWLVTVGFGLATFVSAILVYKKEQYNVLTQVFLTVSSITLFIGGFVWINGVATTSWDTANSSLLVSTVLFAIFAVALYATHKKILHIILTVFFTVAYYACVAKFLKGSGFDLYVLKDVVTYASMILAIGYLMYGSWVKKAVEDNSNIASKSNRTLSSIYTFLAFALFMFAALFLGGFWNFIYAFLAIGAVVLSINLRTQIGLVITSIAIGIYCIKISVQYFADSISFSLALLVSGLLIIALGYLTYYLNKKYIKQQN
ncbi:MAG: hypothetical protein K9M11_01285 [Candidatus Pacebacteria bacterium]|nr:hypothetical protein [Candidatus Paceibacterota bacterium]